MYEFVTGTIGKVLLKASFVASSKPRSRRHGAPPRKHLSSLCPRQEDGREERGRMEVHIWERMPLRHDECALLQVRESVCVVI